MNTVRHIAKGLVQAALLLVLPLGFMTACGGDADYDADSVGVRRYGAPAPGSIDWGEESKAVAIGQAGDISKKPAKPKAAPTKRKKPTARKKPKAGKYTVMTVEGGGTVSGTVKFSAKPPTRIIPFNKDQSACKHDDQPSQRMVYDEANLTVANCFVYLADITKGKDWTGEFAKGEDEREAILDQIECTYVPHVLGVRTNTQLRIKNSDPAEHNVHIYRGNTSGPTVANVLSPAGSNLTPGPAFIEKPAVYEVKCDIHAWMNGYVWALNHPYFAVTGKDGKFSIENVPPGTYTLVMWHEGMAETAQFAGGAISGYDYGDPVESSQKVTVDAGGAITCDFSIDPPSK